MAIAKILIANRGEIAVRVIRTARRLGYETVAVFSEADRSALHVNMADQAIALGGFLPSDSYLDADKIIRAAQQAGADAIHPGYGFLSENAEFAEQCAAVGLVFIGPRAESIRLMGSKRESKIKMLACGVPCIPGYQGKDQSVSKLLEQASVVGFPLMIKASAGGGGRGMRIVQSAKALQEELESARSEAMSAFGNDEVILERAIVNPRHIEFQVFADQHNNYVHLGERDCSIQRRHQKIVEESPSPFLTPDLRQKMAESALLAAQSCDYVGAGTVEFIVDESGEFYFLEMNTRLQVEHPVTELVTGLDLVEWQIRVAAGEALPLSQDQITWQGHAIEVRLCAEDPRQNFLPQAGRLLSFEHIGVSEVRLDSGFDTRTQSGDGRGTEISSYYDSMMAKMIAHGDSRLDATRQLKKGLAELQCLGVHSNKQFLQKILSNGAFIEGKVTTSFLAEQYPQSQFQVIEPDNTAFIVAAVLIFEQSAVNHTYPPTVLHRVAPFFHLVRIKYHHALAGENPARDIYVAKLSPLHFRVRIGTDEHEVVVRPSKNHRTQIAIDANPVTIDFAFGVDHSLFIDDGQGHYEMQDITYQPAASSMLEGGNEVIAAMDGRIVDVRVQVGDQVNEGDVVAVMEAMKMAHPLRAEITGCIESVQVTVGDQVKARQVLARLQLKD